MESLGGHCCGCGQPAATVSRFPFFYSNSCERIGQPFPAAATTPKLPYSDGLTPVQARAPPYACVRTFSRSHTYLAPLPPDGIRHRI